MGFKDENGQIVQHDIHYGELHIILDFILDDRAVWEKMRGTRQLLAVITPCKTNGNDATTSLTEYTKLQATLVTDLQAIQCVVGRGCRRHKTWGIIDRSTDEVRPEFITDVEGTQGHTSAGAGSGRSYNSDDGEDEFF